MFFCTLQTNCWHGDEEVLAYKRTNSNYNVHRKAVLFVTVPSNRSILARNLSRGKCCTQNIFLITICELYTCHCELILVTVVDIISNPLIILTTCEIRRSFICIRDQQQSNIPTLCTCLHICFSHWVCVCMWYFLWFTAIRNNMTAGHSGVK